jgi:hypothetical protein
VLAEAVAVALGVAFLYVFFRAVETNWPASYYAIEHKTERTISSNLLRYCLFRFAPIYIVGAFAGAVLSHQGQAVVVPVLLIAILHAALTAGHALVQIVRSGQIARRPLVVGLHATVIAGCLIAGGAAALTASAFDGYVPTGSDLTSSLVTALAAGVAGAFIVRITAATEPASHEAFEDVRRSISDELWSAAEQEAVNAGAEPRLVQAFMLVESAQRPAWVRRLERMAGRALGAASYGPLQVGADRPLSDREAVSVAIRQRFAGRRVPEQVYDWGTSPDEQWLKLFAFNYNPDDSYATDVVAAYNWLGYPTSSAVARSNDQAPDNLPVVEIASYQWRGNVVLVSGSAVSADGSVVLNQVDGSGSVIDSKSVPLREVDSSRRGKWSHEFQPLSGALSVHITADLGGASNGVTLPL